MKRIQLTQNRFALVDDEDFDWLHQWKWHYLNIGYAARRQRSNRKYIYMHILIYGKNDGEVDHINQDKLDNRRCNLRSATRSQNMMNTSLRITNTSGFKGVWWDETREKWYVEITINSKRIYLGRFTDKIEAAKAYNEAAKEHFKEFAVLNSF